MAYKKWEASKSVLGDWAIISGEELIARELRHWNVHLIVSAINACISLNKDNPLAVAEGISDLYEALEGLINGIHNIFIDEFNKTGKIPYIEGYKEAVMTLAKVREK